jgi:hypothetical protein
VGSDEPSPAGDLVEHYEELRRQALHGDPNGWRLGLAVLQRQGVVAWIRAWDGIAPARASAVAAGAPPECGELVAVLAGMALCVAGG